MKKTGSQSTLTVALVAAVMAAPAVVASPAMSGGGRFNYEAAKDNATREEEKSAEGFF